MTKRCVHSIVVLMLLFFGAVQVNGQNLQTTTDSLISLIPTSEGKEKVDLFNAISYSFRRNSVTELNKYANEAHQLAIDLGYKKGESIALKNIGIGLLKSGVSHDSSIYYFQQAANIAEEIEDFYTQAACMNNVGIVNFYKADFNAAIVSYLKGVEIFNEHFEEENQLKALMICNIGNAFSQLKEYDKAEEYLLNGIEMGKRNGYKSIESMYMDDLASVYIFQNSLEKAEETLLEGFKIQEELGDDQSFMQSLNHYVDILLINKRYNEAIEAAKKAFDLAGENSAYLLETIALVKLSKIYYEKGDLEKAIEYGELGLKNSLMLSNKVYERDVLLILSKSYESLNEIEKALGFMRGYVSVSDSLQLDMQNQLMAQAETKYKVQEKEKEILTLNKAKEEQETQIVTLSVLVGTIASLLILITFLLFQKRKQEKTIQEKNEKLEAYISQNLQLENFAYVASHDLKTPLRSVVSFAQLLKRTASEKLSENEMEYLDFIQRSGKEMNLLVEDIFSFSIVEKTSLKKENLRVEDLLSRVTDNMGVLIKEKKANINFDLGAEYVHGDRIKIQQVLQNLMVNAVKFVPKGRSPKISVVTKKIENKTLFEIRDNGIGIAEEFYETVFVVLKRLNNKTDYDGTGIGLAICKKIVEQHGGEIWVRSNVNQGSSFFFTLP